jgi:diguanylate cyclase (GGDEF)-like protein
MPGRRYLQRADDFLSGRHPLVIAALGLAGVAVIALFDFLTGYELSFAVFYVLPISFVAWYAGRVPALFVSFTSAVAWEEANRLAGQAYSSAFIPFWNAATRLGFFLVISLLLVSLREHLQREQQLSRTDALTGLGNRRAFHEAAIAELARARRTSRPLTVVYIDLDDFKAVNDRLGHETGDRLLHVVAESLRSNLRATDSVARLGGDEFALLLPDTGDAAARGLVDRSRQALQEAMHRNQWQVGFSVGVLVCATAPPDVHSMINMADQLMYGVKTRGKNGTRYSLYTG